MSVLRNPLAAARQASALLRSELDSIRGILYLGFGSLVVLLVVAGALGFRALRSMSAETTTAFADVQWQAALSSRLAGDVSKLLQAANSYLDMRDSSKLADFRALGWQAHATQRMMNARNGQTSLEVSLTASIDEQLSLVEVHYARAHRLADLGRMDEARAAARLARPAAAELLGDMDGLGEVKARRVAEESRRLARYGERRAVVLIALIAVALAVAGTVVYFTVRSVARPLADLVKHALAFSDGNLTVRTTRKMPREFEILGQALNHTGESLSKIVAVVASTSDAVAQSAHDLASVAQQLSQSAGQTSTSMGDVSTGAEQQVAELRETSDALQTMRVKAQDVLSGAAEVNTLAGSIEETAQTRRQELERTLAILTDVKTTVEDAANEVGVLNATANDITRFVTTVSQIAEQTNLLALNAAIEAARAGKAGRGFAVVADEVRKLAEQAQNAADEIVQMTGKVTDRVTKTTNAMIASATRVGEIERISKDVEDALTTIGAAAARTRGAASLVASGADGNVRLVSTAAESLASVARAAEGHAAAAQEVSAATEEQSAACEQMSAASAELLEGSSLLRELVKGLQVDETAAGVALPDQMSVARDLESRREAIGVRQ